VALRNNTKQHTHTHTQTNARRDR